jgi:hypothetical protein
MLLLARVTGIVFTTLVIMGFFWNIMAEGKKEQFFQNYIGFFFNTANQLFINGIFTVLFMIPRLKTVLKREHAANLYRVSTFYLSLALILLLNSLIYAFVFTPATYLSVNLLMKTRIENLEVFSSFLGLNFFMFTLGQYYGLLLGSCLSETATLILSPLIFIFFLLGAGIYRGNDSLPKYVSWLFYTSPYKYFLELEFKNFEDLNDVTKYIPEALNYNFGIKVCVSTLLGIMSLSLIFGFIGLKKFVSKF